MTPKFDGAFNYLLGDEGRKYTNDPNDSGGPTKFGITKRTYEAFFKKSVPDSEIENMTEDTAKQVYFYEFWKPLRLDEIENDGLATAIFDCAVLYSPKISVRMAQTSLRACGRTCAVDGSIGEHTLQALNGIAPFMFLTVYRGQVLLRDEKVVEANPKDKKYLNGWKARADRLVDLANNKQGANS
jgi:lysozyme family protein